MAKSGDIVQCGCGSRFKLYNDRIPWHKYLNQRRNCPSSGAIAENWDSLTIFKGLVLRCPNPKCKLSAHVKNASPQSIYQLQCNDCGSLGNLEEFAAADILKLQSETHIQRKGRY